MNMAQKEPTHQENQKDEVAITEDEFSGLSTSQEATRQIESPNWNLKD